MEQKKEKKVCFVASSGGHLEEISQLRKIASMYESFLVTEKSDFEVKNFCKRRSYIYQMNRRELLFLPKFLWLFVKAWKILRRERPDYVITTGALVAYPFCVLAKAMKKKVVYLESFARVNHASLTGKLLYKHVDLFIVQWEDMLELYPKAVLGGGIF